MNTDRGAAPPTPPTASPAPPSPQLTCDLGALADADLALVDALARLRLAAARQGVPVVLTNASSPLRELLAFTGLADVLPVAPGPPASPAPPGPRALRVQPGREPEQREEHVGVEEVGEPADPAL
ncbi:STAS domain-containing protein [Kitasatospora sp. NBC_01560]|uniref:STAS domain-containing protein n=1 Tax=Kitasatospora sp. NBC_01560 TaxID=2975965 RepID=UPI003865450B